MTLRRRRTHSYASVAADPSELHRLKNQLSIIYGFADLILIEMAPGDPYAARMAEIQKTVMAALEILRDGQHDPEGK